MLTGPAFYRADYSLFVEDYISKTRTCQERAQKVHVSTKSLLF